MMSNLFSIFDTNTSYLFDMNWISTFTNLMHMQFSFWLFKSKVFIFWYNCYLILYKEFKEILLNKFNFLNSIFFISLFFFVLINNFMGLYPYIFTSSSHMIFSLSMSLPLWHLLALFSWLKNTNFTLIHMVPQGTPLILVPLMILIELISNHIRPATLSIRLTANMIAGHLLLTLMSQSASSSYSIITIFVILTQTILIFLEMSVSIIQSYVFTILSILYTKETN